VSEQTRAFRALLEGPELVVVPECFSVITGRVVEQAGFRATYCGGNALGVIHYGIPDYGLITTTEMIEQTARIAANISIPLIVDADQAGETVVNVHRTVRSFEQAGVAAIHIEDTLNPKHSNVRKPLAAISDMQKRLSAAAEARTDPDFTIIARCDELYDRLVYGEGTVDETIARGIAYAEAGADVYMPICMKLEEIPLIVEAVPIPVLDINQPVSKLKETGLKVNVFTGWAMASVVRTHRDLVHHIREHGELARETYGFDREELLDEPRYLAVVKAGT
jgi:2-methylisocitrate lyase-like PEP mutase family enzyme